MIAAVTRVSTLTTIRRRRILPVIGHVLVRRGQKVAATDVIATGDLAPQHLMLDLARGLSLPPDQVGNYIQHKPGDSVFAGDLLAGPVGLARRVVRAPSPGEIILINAGKLLLKVDSPAFELQAGLPGTVVTIIAERGAIIETIGSVVQGVWGNGRIDSGMLARVANRPEEVFTSDNLDVNLRGSIVSAGFCDDPAVLEAAAELPLRGLILASISAALLPAAGAMPYPIMITEGFGLLPMNTAAFQVLSTGDPEEVTLNAEVPDALTFRRPEVIIPRLESDLVGKSIEPAFLEPQKRVRVVRAPYRSQVGQVLQLHQGMTTFPNGLQALGASVRLENGEMTVLPLANLELLE